MVAPKTKKDFIQFEVLDGLAMYCFVHKPDRGNDELKIAPSFKVDLELLDDKELQKAKDLGLKIKSPGGKFTHPYVQIKSKVEEGREPPKALDSQRNAIPPNILIGNGSKVRVKFLPYRYGPNGAKVMPILKEIMVIDLVEYIPTDQEKATKGRFP